MKGMSMLSAIDLTCSDVEGDLGPKIATTPLSRDEKNLQKNTPVLDFGYLYQHTILIVEIKIKLISNH